MPNKNSIYPMNGKSMRWLIIGAIGTGLVVTVAVLSVWRTGFNAAQKVPQFDPQQVALGKQVYVTNCASCHGAELQGQPNWKVELPTSGRPAPPHNAEGHTWHHDDKLLFNIIKKGKDAIALGNYKYNMPAYSDKLSDDEIQAVLVYIKSTWPPEIQAAQRERNEASKQQ